MLMPDWLTWSLAKDVVLALLAAYGAILSTLNWRQARDKERRQVKVALSTVVPVCVAAGSVATRRTGSNVEVIRLMLQACASACRLCGEECERHAKEHDHCRICAEACRRCEKSCQEAVRSLTM